MNKTPLIILLLIGSLVAVNIGHSQADVQTGNSSSAATNSAATNSTATNSTATNSTATNSTATNSAATGSLSADNEKAYKQELNQWILRAYEGDRDAQFKVGVLLTNDQLDTPDYEQAVYWYKQAALQGHALAQYNLGHQFLAGLGVQRSESQAMEWWLKAAEQDHALAQFNVGRGYYLGIGLSENHKKSRAWFERAAKNGEPKSIEILEQISWSEDTASGDEAIAKSPPQTSQDQSVARPAAVSETQTALDAPAEESIALKSVVTESPVESQSQPELGSKSEPEPELALSWEESEPSSSVIPVETQTTDEIAKQSIKLYTNPKNSDRLIAFVNLDENIEIKQRSKKWTSITHAQGFPVWVHSNFVAEKNNVGKITGSNVNARSEPKITDGSIIGRLNKGETLEVLQKSGLWYQLNSPSRFVAWVKTEDLGSPSNSSGSTANTTENSATTPTSESTATANSKTNSNTDSNANPNNKAEPAAASNNGQTLNDSDSNEWLFNQSPEGYTLQLATFSEKDNATRFLEDRNINADPNLRAFASQQDSNNWIYYLYGSYLSQSEAKKAKKGLKLPKAWVRTFEELQQNRCVTWKTQLPTPQELKTYCVQ